MHWGELRNRSRGIWCGVAPRPLVDILQPQFLCHCEESDDACPEQRRMCGNQRRLRETLLLTPVLLQPAIDQHDRLIDRIRLHVVLRSDRLNESVDTFDIRCPVC